MTLVQDLQELGRSQELMGRLTSRELRGKYRGSALGWGWSLLNPLATMLVYTFVFSLLLRIAPPTGTRTHISNFAMFLLCGLLPWTMFSNAVTTGASALVSNGNLIKKVYFRRETLVASAVLALLVTLLIELGVLSVALLFFGDVVLLRLPAIAGLIVLLTLFSLGLALVVSVLNVYFRDVQYIIGIGMQIWFYATPIIYPIAYAQRFGQEHSVLGVSAYTLYQANPLVAFVEGFRDAFYDGVYPSLSRWGIMLVWTAISVVVGYAVFQHYQARLAEEL